MNEEKVASDVTIVGGGLAGVCAAIAAARTGSKVALIGNRPVLGGNSSSEVRVWVVGATAHGYNHNAREGGIMGELFVENQYRNPDGNPYLWDALIYEKVTSEPNISLFLNTDVRIVDASGPADDRVIRSVTGWTMGSERLIEFTGPIFVDATGDGLVGFLAGAEHRIGREARSEYAEPWAPDIGRRHHARQYAPLLYEGRRVPGAVRRAGVRQGHLEDEHPAEPHHQGGRQRLRVLVDRVRRRARHGAAERDDPR